MSDPLHLRVISAPTDVGAGVLGARMGPEALRVAGIAQALRQFGVELHDPGDLSGPPNPGMAEPVGAYRHFDQVVAWCRQVHDATLSALQAGQVPLLLGGDHSLAVGSIGAVARHCRDTAKPLRVLWFDAHADFNTAQTTPSGNLHGMPLAVLCGLGPAELTCLSGQSPALRADQVRQIGVRSVDPIEKRLLHDTGIEVFDMRYVDEVGMRAVMEQALRDLPAGVHLHVSFDVDFLDPQDAPGVGTPVRGGPSYREAQLCMEMLADAGGVGSLDLVELNPALDHANASARLCIDLLESLFGKSTLLRLHRSGLNPGTPPETP